MFKPMLLTLTLPLLGATFAGFFGRLLGPKGSVIITCLCLLSSFIFQLLPLYEVCLLGCPTHVLLCPWIDSELLNVDWGCLFDSLTVILCVVITSISTCVHFYSIEYMASDPHLSRFMSYLSGFTFCMLLLVTADNFVQMFVGWEGVGLCSYLLINFWFTRIQANKAAIKAMVLNRIGDFGLMLGILFIFITFKAVDYATVFSLISFLKDAPVIFFGKKFEVLLLISACLFIGAIGKSAQLGLHTWLPDAMEGPTPVSALIHAATMVTAGVFLITRCSPIYEYSPSILQIITVLGGSTAFFAATVGLLQNDLKKVIAYSTCSQLGYMVFACGLSNYSVGVFHLVNHAFFKALLFLGAGSVIHAVADEQDMRKMGGLKNLIPFTYSLMVIGSLALTGFPFLAGFYSKDLVLEVAYGKFTVPGHFCYYLGTLGAFLTAFYSTRLLYLTFLSKPNGYKSVICSAYDSSYYICISLGILAVPSILIGYYAKEMLVGLGSDFWGTAIYISPLNMNQFDAEFIIPFFKLLPVILSIMGLFMAFGFYSFHSEVLFTLKTSIIGQKIYNFLNKKWFFDKLYGEMLAQGLLNFSYMTSYKTVDRGIFEVVGPHGVSLLLFKISGITNKIQTGFIYHYTLVFLVGLILVLGFQQINILIPGSYCITLIFYIFVLLCLSFSCVKRVKNKSLRDLTVFSYAFLVYFFSAITFTICESKDFLSYFDRSKPKHPKAVIMWEMYNDIDNNKESLSPEEGARATYNVFFELFRLCVSKDSMDYAPVDEQIRNVMSLMDYFNKKLESKNKEFSDNIVVDLKYQDDLDEETPNGWKQKKWEGSNKYEWNLETLSAQVKECYANEYFFKERDRATQAYYRLPSYLYYLFAKKAYYHNHPDENIAKQVNDEFAEEIERVKDAFRKCNKADIEKDIASFLTKNECCDDISTEQYLKTLEKSVGAKPEGLTKDYLKMLEEAVGPEIDGPTKEYFKILQEAVGAETYGPKDDSDEETPKDDSDEDGPKDDSDEDGPKDDSDEDGPKGWKGESMEELFVKLWELVEADFKELNRAMQAYYRLPSYLFTLFAKKAYYHNHPDENIAKQVNEELAESMDCVKDVFINCIKNDIEMVCDDISMEQHFKTFQESAGAEIDGTTSPGMFLSENVEKLSEYLCVFSNNSLFLNEYLGILVYFLFSILLSYVIIGFSYLFVVQNPETEKMSAYECGFEPYEDARQKFDIKFYIVAILFIIFDIEIMFLIPWSVTLPLTNYVGYFVMMEFLLELGVSFLYVWCIGGLDWE